MTVAEAASAWLDAKLHQELGKENAKIIKPAAGYASCPDHTLKADILNQLCGHIHMHNESQECTCGHCHGHGLGIELTESYAMIPESSICGMIFMHPEAFYPEIRRISSAQYDNYSTRRGMDADTARRFLGHLIK